MTKKFKDRLCDVLVGASVVLLIYSIVLEVHTIVTNNYDNFVLTWAVLLIIGLFLLIRYILKQNKSHFLNK
jgi:hypothetical protein